MSNLGQGKLRSFELKALAEKFRENAVVPLSRLSLPGPVKVFRLCWSILPAPSFEPFPSNSFRQISARIAHAVAKSSDISLFGVPRLPLLPFVPRAALVRECTGSAGRIPFLLISPGSMCHPSPPLLLPPLFLIPSFCRDSYFWKCDT